LLSIRRIQTLLAAVLVATMSPSAATQGPHHGPADPGLPSEQLDGEMDGIALVPDHPVVQRNLVAPAGRAAINGYTKYGGALSAPAIGARPHDTSIVTPVGGYGIA
jgi:hypothetical protein